jgi:hypothetical protein
MQEVWIAVRWWPAVATHAGIGGFALDGRGCDALDRDLP